MLIKSSLITKLYFLKVYYFLLDKFSNLPRNNKFIVRQKIYVGVSIISLSLFINSCGPNKSSNTTPITDTIRAKPNDSLKHVTNDTIAQTSVIESLISIEEYPDTIVSCYDVVIPDPAIFLIEDSTTDAGCYITVEINDNDDTLSFVEQMPVFKTGHDSLMTYLRENTIYPKDAASEGLEGNVYVTFVINKNGDVVYPRILRSIHPSLDAEALRVIKQMPPWKPGIQYGTPVNVKMSLPIKFKLSE